MKIILFHLINKKCAACFNLFLLIFFCSIEACRKGEFTINSNVNAVTITKPNIVLILGDDVGYEIPTVDGGQSYSTPNIDQLAQSGMRFTQMRSAPNCSPSRFMLLTGKYNFRNYIEWGKMPLTEKTIANMLRDAGYTTCFAGKWQLDGGDQSIRNFGFDHYSVWLPFFFCPENVIGPRYKSAKIYQDGNYLPDSITNDKYSEDVVADYVMNFIDSNKAQPFFVFYSMIVCHRPFSPTPDDPEYAVWDPNPMHSDPKYYPSMVKYMDKKIGLVIQKLDSLGIAGNTIVVYAGDNGTPEKIVSFFKGKKVTGAKSTSLEYGIHVPLICRWPGTIPAGKINGNLMDFTDILPTFADVANISVPTNYGKLDGFSFYPQLTSAAGTPRTSVFCHWSPNSCQQDTVVRYAQDSVYKLYETGRFYKFNTDLNEKKPLAESSLTKRQKKIKQNLQNVINAMHN